MERTYDPLETTAISLTMRTRNQNRDCCYQHLNGSDALEALSSSSRQGCRLCTILRFSLEASRQSLPKSILKDKTPELPQRLPTEAGITLHSFDNHHFIVRDDHRWSLVRFSKGNRVNEEGFLLHENANDIGVFALIDGWMSRCQKSHASCTLYRLNSHPSYVPARLIRIEKAQEQVRLRLCDKIDYQRSADYVALSHCWGDDPRLVPRTTIANLQSRMKNIPWGDLTKTFQDAMDTTFKLGKSYIWIDSLCIVQDNTRDVEVHCESMSQIYSNSVCTISATGAKDGTQGLFIPRNNVEMHSCVIAPVMPPKFTEWIHGDYEDERGRSHVFTIPPTFREWTHSMKGHLLSRSWTRSHVFTILPTFREWTHSMKGHLLSRGWTLQERELSVRVLHFTSDRVVWECRECYASEDDPTLKSKSMLFDVGLKFRLLDGGVLDRKRRPYNYKFTKWMELVEEYSMRKLSIRDDKLKAIAGLADAIKHIQQDDVYLSGLWKRDLVTGLLWHAIPNLEHAHISTTWPPIPVTRGIPTWSWAAFDGAVVFDRSQESEVNVLSVHVKRAISSQITLFGPVFNVLLSETECELSKSGVYQKHYKWPRDSSTYQIYITLDADPQSLREIQLLCLVLVKYYPPRTSLPSYSQSSSGSNTQVSLYYLSNFHRLSSKELDCLSRAIAKYQVQDVPRRVWDGYRSATGLVLLRGSTGIDGCNNLSAPSYGVGATATFRRIGIFNAKGSIPDKTTVEVNIV